jgi:cobalt-zinc-cadmium efflux system outer membrane protein
MRLMLLLAGLGLASAAQAGPLTFNAAQELALRSPVITGTAAELEAAKAQRLAAGKLPDPRVRLGLDNFPISGPPAGTFAGDSMTMVSVGLMQDRPSVAKREAARQAAQAEVTTAGARQALTARETQVAAALAWIDLFYTDQKLAALAAVERAITPLRDTAPAAVTAGDARPGQALEAQQKLAAMADRRSELLADRARAAAELTRWTGEPGPQPVGPAPDFVINAEALRAGLPDHPSLRALDAARQTAGAQLAQARAEAHPDTSWDVAYQKRDGAYGDMVSVGVTFGLPLFGQARREPLIAAQSARVRGAESQKAAGERQLLAALETDLAEHQMHHEQLARAQETLAPLAQQRADLETASYAAGRASLSDVLGALLDLAETKLSILDRQALVARDSAKINLSYGTAS